MRRDPSIHITKSSLVDILNGLEITHRTSGVSLADKIFESAQPVQIRDRYLDILNTKAAVKAKVLKSQTVDSKIHLDKVEVFHRTLMSYRQSKDFVKVKPISLHDRDYILLKEITAMAYEFVEHFEINNTTDGLLEYIKLGTRFMGKKYGLNKFKTYDKRIYEYFEAYIFVLNDDFKGNTSQFFQLWKDKMLSYHDMMKQAVNIEDDYIKYSNMVYGRMEADEMEADYEEWIDAQFEQLKFINTIPELGGFHGENAKNRYIRYTNELVSNEEENSSDILNYYKKDKNGG